MKELPILFSTEMVQAIMQGRKTKTRRICKPIPIVQDPVKITDNSIGSEHIGKFLWPTEKGGFLGFCPYGRPGDLLYVRETCRQFTDAEGKSQIQYLADNPEPIYECDGDGFQVFNKDGSEKMIPWKPSIHMPKSAARIWLKVTDVRVERLGSLNTEQALQEGFIAGDRESPSDAYKNYWFKSIREEAWMQRPWAWVISFEVLSTTGKPTELLAPAGSIV